MGKIIAVVNQKGGVGKTTTTVNLAAALTELGLKTLVCDFDPQANATSGLGIDKKKLKKTVYDVIINDEKVENAIVSTTDDSISLIFTARRRNWLLNWMGLSITNQTILSRILSERVSLKAVMG